MTTATQPTYDIRSITVRNPDLDRHTLNNGTTRVVLRQDAETKVIIDVFLPFGAYGYELNFPETSGMHVSAVRILRVVRVTIAGSALQDQLRLAVVCKPTYQWTINDVTTMFAPYLVYLQFKS